MREPGINWRGAVAVLAIVFVLAGLGAGAYLVGHAGGEDLAAARAAGTASGLEAGERRGEHRGYERAFEHARAQSFSRAYAAAFRDEYAQAFRRLGVPPPLHVNVPDVRAGNSSGG